MPAPLPGRMDCVEIAEPGGPEVLVAASRPLPYPAAGEVLIQVAAAGVNRADVFQRTGRYPPPPGVSDLPGLEVAGKIVALGDGVTQWAIGDSVCALIAGGGYATYCTAPAAQCLPVPRGLDMVAAASLPETFFTVWSNVFDRCRLQAGETLLVQGGTSGVGMTAIQLATQMGATVFATAGSAEKCRACVEFGAARAINYREEDFVEVIKQATDGQGVDVILDIVGGDYVDRNIRCLAVEGRLVQVSVMNGSKVEIDMRPVMTKRLTLTGSTLRPRPVAHKEAYARTLLDKVWPLIESGRIRPVVYRAFPLAKVAEAHRLMESSRHIGKIVLIVDDTMVV